MTEKDYLLIAKAFIEARRALVDTESNAYLAGQNIALYKLCDALQNDNASFDREQFLNYIAKEGK